MGVDDEVKARTTMRRKRIEEEVGLGYLLLALRLLRALFPSPFLLVRRPLALRLAPLLLGLLHLRGGLRGGLFQGPHFGRLSLCELPRRGDFARGRGTNQQLVHLEKGVKSRCYIGG